MRTIGEFELIDHGIGYPNYLQGCGQALTSFANVVMGAGDNPAEAIDDCLELMAQDGFDIWGLTSRIMAQEGWEKMPLTPSTYELHGPDGPCYHVSICWNEAAA